MIRRCALLLSALALVAGCSSGGGDPKPSGSELIGGGGGTFQGAGLTPAQPRPSFTLTDTAGSTFSFGTTTAKQPTLLYFGYTNCPDVCPTTLADVSQALKGMPAAVAKKTYVVFVTTDVKRDTGPVMKQWLANFSAGTPAPAKFVGLTGTQAQVDAAQAAAHVTVAEDNGETHSSELLLYGADDYARVGFLQSTKLAQQIEHDLPIVAKT